MILRLYISLFIIVTGFLTLAQSTEKESRLISIENIGDTIVLDSLSINASTFVLKDNDGRILDSSQYVLDAFSGILIIKDKNLLGKPLKADYKTFPFSLSRAYYHKDPERIKESKQVFTNPFLYKGQSNNTDEIFELGGLDKSGSISRGIGFGNNRDLSVSSSMNLQLSGKLSENLFVLAAINDENIPIQPDGNTQQLQDFDQVYIQVYNERAKLIAGDFKLEPPNSYFMKYLKRAQGVSGQAKFYLNEHLRNDTLGGSMDVQISGALSRGKFSRNIIQGVEGNQGPYRLTGAENESFIIILSGTERVYIDGKLLTRGQENDYIINYNTSEVTFTAKQIVTKDKRIIIEFQYSDQSYARSLVQFSNEYKKDKLTLRLNVYSEQDAKNQSLLQDLSDQDKLILANSGDSLSNAFAPGYRPVEFNENEVLYKMVDTLGYDSVFVYSVHPDSAGYRVSFTQVGIGRGDYVLTNSVANGRVFQWVEPQGGFPSGEYAPIRILFAPKQKQMATIGGEYVIDDKSMVEFEGAISNNNLNTFSNKDSENDIGYGFKSQWKQALFNEGKEDSWAVVPLIGIEHWDNDFSEIERIRTVEFYRDWNLRNQNLQAEQNIAKAGIGYEKNDQNLIRYTWDGFYAESQYEAQRNELLTRFNKDKFYMDFNGSYLKSKSTLNSTEFLRHKAFLKQRVLFFDLGYRDDREDNRIVNVNQDTLSPAAYQFWEKEVFVSSPDSTKNSYKVFASQRHDYKPKEDKMKLATYAENYGFNYNWKSYKYLNVGLRTTYRILSIKDDRLTTEKPDENLLSRLEYNLRLLRGGISANSFYEIGSGLEAKKEYTYIEVASGQGAYTWVDYNKNGIKELNEFEIAVFQDQADYIRIFLTTDDYVKSFFMQFNQSFYINMAKLIKDKTGIKKVFAAFANQTAYRIDRKTGNDDLNVRFNPLPNQGLDTHLVSLNSSLRNTVYLNRTHPVFGVDWTYQDIKGRTLLTNGYESRVNEYHGLRIRWNLTRMFLLENEGRIGRKLSESDFISTRDYDLDYYVFNPKLTFQPGVSFRTSVYYSYTEKRNNPLKGGEVGLQHKVGSETRFNKVGKGSFTVELNFIQVTYQGVLENSLAFEILEGLQPGNNATWQVSYQRTIGKYLQLDVSYNGRASEEVKTVHAGTVRVRAYF